MKKIEKKNIHRQRKGFTLVELLVSIGIFSVLVTIATGSYAQALRSQRQLTALLAANSNVSLTLEQMTRELRTGFDFCDGALMSWTEVDTLPLPGETVCDSPSEVTFHNAGIDDVSYRVRQVIVGGMVADGFIERREISVSGTDFKWQRLTADNVVVETLDFTLMNDSNYPPRITISIGVRPKEKVGGVMNLQTTVSARLQ